MAFYVVESIKEIVNKDLNNKDYYEVELSKFGDVNKRIVDK